MSKYIEIMIQPCPSGFGEYQCVPLNGEAWDDIEDLLAEITANHDHVYELTDEIVASVLPGQAEDIRGRIHNEPDRVFAIVGNDYVTYFGISAV